MPEKVQPDRESYRGDIKRITPEELADAYGNVRAMAAPLNEKLEDLKAEVKRRRRRRFIGTLWELNLSSYDRTGYCLETLIPAIEKRLGKGAKAFLKRHFVSTPSKRITCNARIVQQQATPKRRRAVAKAA